MKHTPGPWWVEAGKYFRAIRSSEQVIADMRMVNNFCKEADANLIAAAPDLLQALNELQLAVTMRPMGQGGLSFQERSALDNARSTIKKATGGTE